MDKIKSTNLNKQRTIRKQIDFYLKKNKILENPYGNGIKLNYKIKLFFESLSLEVPNGISLKNFALELYENPAFEYLKVHSARPDIPFTKWKNLRKRVIEKYGYKCNYCGSTEKIAIDHIKPYSKFPELALEFSNLQPLCKSCNSKKSNKYIF